MRLATMIGDLVRSLTRRPATRLYPLERTPAPARLRGPVRWEPSTCTGCRVCVMDCPSEALELVVLDKAARRFVLRYDLGRCTFCGQCVASCVRHSLRQGSDAWELSDTDPGTFRLAYGAPEDVTRVLADEAGPGPAGPSGSVGG